MHPEINVNQEIYRFHNEMKACNRQTNREIEESYPEKHEIKPS